MAGTLTSTVGDEMGGGMRVIVIGAGLGGLTLANGLRRAGIDVVVCERDGVRGRPQGISLHIDERGADALRACLSTEQFELALGAMGGRRDRVLSLVEADGGLVAEEHDSIPRPGRQAHRPLLREALLAGVADAVRFGTTFDRFEQCPDSTVRVWFADGSTTTADVLVGADGIGSAVRRQYLPQAEVLDTGRRTLMGATPLHAIAGTGLPDLIGDNPATAQVSGVTVVVAMLRFSQPPAAAEDYAMWAIPVTAERLGEAASPAALTRRAQELTTSLPPALRLVVEQARPELTVALRIARIPPIPDWPASHVTVVGDAIHLAPGFGGNLAMRDAQYLCEALARADRNEQDLCTAIGDYEAAMRRESFAAVMGA